MNKIAGLRGVVPAVLTPFREDLSIDEAQLRKHLREVSQVPGVTGLVLNGHAGEASALTEEEYLRVIRIAREVTGEGFPLISGVIEEGTFAAVSRAKAAKAAGADAILLFPPNTFGGGGCGTPERPIQFVKAVAEGADLPILVFQFSTRGSLGYTTETLVRMVEEIPQVVGFKEGSDDYWAFEQNVRALRALERPVSIFTTNNNWLFASLCLGGVDGIISGSGAVIADLHAQLFDAIERMDLAAARAVNDRIFPLTKVFYVPPLLDMHNRMKAALQMMGRLDNALVRPPLLPVGPEERARIRAALVEGGLLS